jgi:hypothetical protein
MNNPIRSLQVASVVQLQDLSVETFNATLQELFLRDVSAALGVNRSRVRPPYSSIRLSLFNATLQELFLRDALGVNRSRVGPILMIKNVLMPVLHIFRFL